MKQLLLLTLFCLTTINALSQVDGGILTKPWTAFWIDVPQEPEQGYGVYDFRKSFVLEEKPSDYIIHVSGDNRYKLFVNGTLVSLGPARCDIFHWNFETVDIAPFLTKGQNVVAAIVWNFGSKKPEAQMSWRTGFILQGNSSKEEVINTNKSWKCVRDKSYQPLEPQLLYSYYVSGPGELVDFKEKQNEGWLAISFDDSTWKAAHEISSGLPKGVFGWTNGWMLVPRKIPPMEMTVQRLASLRTATGIVAPKDFPQKKSSIEIKPNSKISLLLDQSHLTNAYPVIEFSKGTDATITVSYAEALYVKENSQDWRTEKQKGNRNDIQEKRFVGVSDQLISSGRSNQVFIPLWWRTYRYIQLEIETKGEALVLEDIYGIFTGYPFQFNAAFDAGSDKLKNILDVGWRTARLCAVETYMDCPYYEQLQYIGDTRIQSLVSLYNSGDDRLVRNAIEQIDHSRMAEGISLSRFPSANAQQIPTFSLWYIGMLYDYWMHRPDPAFIEDKLPAVRSVLYFFEKYQGEDGLVKNAPYWEFTDWCRTGAWKNGVAPIGKDGTSAVIDLQLCLAYQTASVLEENLGSKENSKLFQERANKIKQSIIKEYWDENKKLFADTKEKEFYSQHANTLAILAEIVNGEDAKALMQKVLSDKTLAQATIYFKYYVHQALNKCGFGNQYLELLTDWNVQIDNGLTTWAEISDYNIARSDCHAWGASPNIELFRIVLGVETDAPGFQKVKIEPHPGKLEKVKGSMPHPNGKIDVDLSSSNQKWKATVVLPPNTSGRFIWNGKEFDLKSGRNLFSDLEKIK